MDKIIPISDLQSKAKRYVDQVKNTSEPVVITQRGRAAAVLISYAEYEGLKATEEEVSFSDWRKRLTRAETESAENKGVALEQYIKNRANSK